MTAASEKWRRVDATVCKRQERSGQLLYIPRRIADDLGLREGDVVRLMLRRRG